MNPEITYFSKINISKKGGLSILYKQKVYILGVLKKGGGGGYPQALLEGLASEARY